MGLPSLPSRPLSLFDESNSLGHYWDILRVSPVFLSGLWASPLFLFSAQILAWKRETRILKFWCNPAMRWMGMEGRVAETCSRTACSGCYDREGPQMSGHHHMLLFIPHCCSRRSDLTGLLLRWVCPPSATSFHSESACHTWSPWDQVLSVSVSPSEREAAVCSLLAVISFSLWRHNRFSDTQFIYTFVVLCLDFERLLLLGLVNFGFVN